ncbi:MAG: lysylphosphatidylglycerol synthase transmembrane domain-containing protein [Ktedonobacteraceae bacterium]
MLSYHKKEGSDPRQAFNRVKLIPLDDKVMEQGNAHLLHSVKHTHQETPLPSEKLFTSAQHSWRSLFSSPVVQGTLGILVGISLLIAVAHFVDIPTILRIIQRNLTTPQGILFTFLASLAFVTAFCFRAVRWKFFLNPVRKVGAIKIIQLFLIGVFLNFVLPIRAGELAKSLVLKRIARVPLNQSLPSITMDKAMDLLPGLFLVALIPFLGVHLNKVFWSILGLANAGLLGLIVFVVLAGWKRSVAIRLLQLITKILPSFIKRKVEAFIIGFVDTLLLSAKRPKTLIMAVLLTSISVFLDGLYNFFAFWAIGHPISITEALFGYMLFNLFYILPNPPGQVGSNEVVALLIFSGILHIPPESVTAMVVFFHPWSGLLMCTMGMGCLSTLGVSLSSAINVQTEGEHADAPTDV